MNVKQLQTELTKLGHDVGGIDGIAGRKTMAAVDKVIAKFSSADEWKDWPDPRRTIAAEQAIYHEMKIYTGEVDGLIGELTRYARTVYQARLKNDGKPVPKVEEWRDKEKPLEPSRATVGPWPRQRDVESFYGSPGSGWTLVKMPFPLRLAWDMAKTIPHASVHSKCEPAFKRIWERVHAHYGHGRLKELRLDLYGGAGNVRRMRGGTRWSMHAYGCAWDVDPDRNQLRWTRDKATLDEAVYKPFWDIIYEEGALSLGKERNYDWMHFQFTRDFS